MAFEKNSRNFYTGPCLSLLSMIMMVYNFMNNACSKNYTSTPLNQKVV